MKINKSQTRVIVISSALILTSLIVWVFYGAEIFTKTKVLIEVEDEIFGPTKVWQDKFILGLDYTLAFCGVIVLIASGWLWKLKKKVK